MKLYIAKKFIYLLFTEKKYYIQKKNTKKNII